MHTILALAAGLLTARVPVDTTITVRGILQLQLDSAGRPQRALLSLAVLPPRFAWQVEGRPSGVTPVALFRIGNHGETELQCEFASNEFVCVSVLSADGDEVWSYQWRYPAADTRLTVRVGTVFWAMVPLPRGALPDRGRYTVRASLCGVPDYQAETTVEVTG